jgi:predicted amidohydrolase
VSRTLNIAAAQYQLDELQSQAQYEDKISRWVEDAVAADAKLLVFPEYGAMELAALAGPEVAADLQVVSTRYPNAWNFRPRCTLRWLPAMT